MKKLGQFLFGLALIPFISFVLGLIAKQLWICFKFGFDIL
jgi:hypothetical protein